MPSSKMEIFEIIAIASLLVVLLTHGVAAKA